MPQLPNDDLLKAVFSNPAKKENAKKTVFSKVSNGEKIYWTMEYQVGNKMMTATLSEKEVLEKFTLFLENIDYKNISFFSESTEYLYLFSKKGKLTVIKHANKDTKEKSEHNNQKNYLIPEGSDAPFLYELGIFTKDGKIVNKMYDKYRQINRFCEILDHSFKNIDKEEISIIDFGCGKSYLTFVIYYYFSKIKKLKVRIYGYDLKADVVENCNMLAKKFGYNGLEFVVADVEKDKLSENKTDMVISLHACDTATDAALLYAINHNVKYIFSVPCCQHEINSQIDFGGDFDIMLKYGLIKERFSALLTDSMRLEILKNMGYSVDAIEFVDFTHSPKNIMIRAKKVGKPDFNKLDLLFELEEKYKINQTLLHKITEK